MNEVSKGQHGVKIMHIWGWYLFGIHRLFDAESMLLPAVADRLHGSAGAQQEVDIKC